MTRERIHLEGSWFIRAPRGEVYRIITDFERMPEYFPKVAKSLRITNREGNNLTIEAEAKSFGRVIQTRMNTRLRPEQGFVSDNQSALGTAGHEEFMLEEVPEGTRINYTYDVELKNTFLRIFAKPLIGWYAMRFWRRAVIDNLKEMLEK